jgi:hypothetical protein
MNAQNRKELACNRMGKAEAEDRRDRLDSDNSLTPRIVSSWFNHAACR